MKICAKSVQEEKDHSFQAVVLELMYLLSSVTSTIGIYLHCKTKGRDEEFLEIGAKEGAFRASGPSGPLRSGKREIRPLGITTLTLWWITLNLDGGLVIFFRLP